MTKDRLPATLRRVPARLAPLAAVALLAGCATSHTDTGSGPTSHAVVYYVTGTARAADVTLDRGIVERETFRNVPLPLKTKSGRVGLRFTARTGQTLFLVAFASSGSVSCRIVEDGRDVATYTDAQTPAIAKCEATA